MGTKEIKTVGFKTRRRVKEFGEVFTPEHIVKDMCDLIPLAENDEKELRKTWLEPSCGTGNFLVEILDRKLKIVEKLGEENQDRNLFTAVASIYGIDIQPDNVEESQARMGEILSNWYKEHNGKEMDPKLIEVLEFVMEKNIVWGNGLTGRVKQGNEPDKNGHGGHEEIVFVEWNMDGDMVHMKGYTLNGMTKELEDPAIVEWKPVRFMRVPSAKKIDFSKITNANDMY